MGVMKAKLQEAEEAGDFSHIDEPGPESEVEVPQELLDAEERCPDVKFVKSCREFFERRGFLSEKQRDALRYAGTKNRRRNYWYGYEPGVDEG